MFNRSSKFFGFASATGTSIGPDPIGKPVESSKNCSRRVPASFGISSILCCSLALSAASVSCLLLGGGKTVAMISDDQGSGKNVLKLLCVDAYSLWPCRR